VLYRLQYRTGSRDRTKAVYVDENGFDAAIARGNAEVVEFVRSAQGLDGLAVEVRWPRQRDRARDVRRGRATEAQRGAARRRQDEVR
jgi:hypothetical protein